MTTIDIQWIDMEPKPWEAAVARFSRKVLRSLGRSGWTISVVFCNDVYMTELNARFRGKEEPTDILSFSQMEGESPDSPPSSGCAGDIVISVESLRSNAAEFGISENEELKRLIVHGILHLTGMNHDTNEIGEPMIELQERILREFAGESLL
jgi:probable rRNA maturation factor